MLVDRADFAELGALEAHRQRCWEQQRDYILATSPFYQRAWAAGISPPISLAALADLPLTDKEMLRASQREHPPFGDYLAAPTTCRCACPSHVRHDRHGDEPRAVRARMRMETAVVGGRAQSAAGLGPGHRVVHCLNYRLWMGGFTDHTTLEATGATVVPFGVGETQLLIRTILELGITAISCTPVLSGGAGARDRRAFSRSCGRAIWACGSACSAARPGSTIRSSAAGWRAPGACRCATRITACPTCSAISPARSEHDNDLHFMALDVLHPELIEPESGARAALARRRARRTGADPCQSRVPAAGALPHRRHHRADRHRPRRDAAAPHRAFASSAAATTWWWCAGSTCSRRRSAAVLNRHDALSGEYRIVLDGPGPYDALPVEAEVAEAMGDTVTDGLADAVAAAIKRDLGVTARVTLLPFGTLPRTEGKTRRVHAERIAHDRTVLTRRCRRRRACRHVEPASPAQRDRARIAGGPDRGTGAPPIVIPRCARSC